MRQQKVKILPGEILWEALKRENMMMPRPCGGKGTCGKCQVMIKGIGMVKSCLFCQPGEYEVILSQEERFSVVGQILPEEQKKEIMGDGFFEQGLIIGIDLGTTTIAARGILGDRTLIRSSINPQRAYGADVMTRIDASVNGYAEELKEQIITRLNKMIAELVEESGLEKKIEVTAVVSGNTTMLHLLRGLSCEGLGKAPFRPVELGLCQESWNIPLELGLCRESWNAPVKFEEEHKSRESRMEPGESLSISEVSCLVTYLPGISAFVGGDIVSGIYALELMEKEEISLLLDLGTNGEMALLKDKEVLVASAAAGPAFEGTPLALELHAAGIINLLYFMRKENIIDEYGTLCDEYFEEGYEIPEGFKQNHGADDSRLRIVQEDIRAIQMAKGAIRAGIEILLQEADVHPEQVAKIYLAGGMGFYLEAEKAVGIGLLPEGFVGRMEAVGNTSLQGAVKYGKAIASGKEKEKQGADRMLDEILQRAREIVLANHPDFEDKYIENMNF